METYSVDLRERVMRAVEEGFDTRKEIAESFGCNRRSSLLQGVVKRGVALNSW